MTAIGNPMILTYTVFSDVLRLFEFNEDVGFIQVGSLNTTQRSDGDTGTATMMFSKAGSPLAKSGNMILFDKTLTRVGTVAGAGLVGAIWGDISKRSDVIVLLNEATNQNAITIAEGVGTALDTRTPLMLGIGGTTFKSLRLHPNDDYAFVATNNGGRLYRQAGRTGGTPDRPIYDIISYYVIPELTAQPKDAQWSPDGKYLFVLGTDSRLYCFSLNPTANSVEFLYSILLASGGSGRFLRWRSDGKFLAVSYADNVGRVFTQLYHVYGGFGIQAGSVISDFGQTLGFTQDGKYLIDVFYVRLFEYNSNTDDYFENSVLLGSSGIPVGQHSAMTISPHVTGNNVRGRTYVATNKMLLERDTTNLPLTGLKMMLLNNSATFNVDDVTTVGSANLGSHEVAGNGWPVGGSPIAGVAYDTQNKTTILKATDILQPITADLTFRYMVAYDSVNDRPVAFYDLGSDMVASNSISITFYSNGLLTIAS